LLLIIVFLAFFSHFGIADTRLSLPDLPADAWQLHDGCVSGLLGPARAVLNSRSANANVSSDSFTNALFGYLHSNHSLVKDVKQDRRRKSVSDATVEAARKEKNCLKKVARKRDSTPRDRRTFNEVIRSHFRLKRIHVQAQREKMQCFRNGPTGGNFITMLRKPLLELLGVGVIHPSSQLKLQIGTIPRKKQVPVRLQQGPLSWFLYLPEEKFGHAFDMSPISPSLVRKVLGSKEATSGPGPNELM